MRQLSILLILLVTTSACAKRPRVQVQGSDTVAVSNRSTVADGQASYYGDPYHGRRTASGETFDKNKMTAAHRTLPFNTWVRVRNVLNGKTVDVRINDRGPFVGGRVIDLSEGAARKIEMIRAGVVPVSLEVIKESGDTAAQDRPTENIFYVVQLGAFRNPRSAENLRQRFAEKYTGIYVDPPAGESPFYRVRIGRSLLREARYIQDLLRREDDLESIVVQMQ